VRRERQMDVSINQFASQCEHGPLAQVPQ
jgi:hypothetical protein